MAHLPGTLFARNLVERRGLVFQLVRRDFEQRFVGCRHPEIPHRRIDVALPIDREATSRNE